VNSDHDFLDMDALKTRSGMTRDQISHRLSYARKVGKPVARQKDPIDGVTYSWQDFKAVQPVDGRHAAGTSLGMSQRPQRSRR